MKTNYQLAITETLDKHQAITETIDEILTGLSIQEDEDSLQKARMTILSTQILAKSLVAETEHALEIIAKQQKYDLP